MGTLPTGTVTFLFTDIEGSTRLAREDPAMWERSRQIHDSIMRSSIESRKGVVFQIVGDSCCSAFPTAGGAVRAAVDAQRRLQAELGGTNPLRVRMGIHTGEAEAAGQDYRGYITLSTVQRIMSVASGGQILLSDATESLLHSEGSDDIGCLDLGECRLKDVPMVMRIFQVLASGLQSQFPTLRALECVPNNLPARDTSFLGREKEISEVQEALASHQLLTVIGLGGAGKTTLAIEVGITCVENARATGHFPNGIFFVSLTALQEPDAIVPALASAIGFSFYPGSEPRAQLLDYLHEKSMLLILDNCEHLLGGVDLFSEITRRAPRVRLLVTSRTRLNLQNEQIIHLAGMDMPARESAEDIAGYDSVRLFLEHARRLRHDFKLSTENLKYVVRICRLVDGLPLAIVLAASWLAMLSPMEISEEIERSLDFLETEARDLPERQRSMRAVFEYSWNLLTQRERATFRNSSVFRGGFTRQAALQVMGCSLRDLMSLTDKSLLQRDWGGRYQLHELLRQYAWEKLAQDSAALEDIRTRHCHFYGFFCGNGSPVCSGGHRSKHSARSDPKWRICARPGSVRWSRASLKNWTSGSTAWQRSTI